jgi:LAS superfamily LD-carboxypeptidase LdcB
MIKRRALIINSLLAALFSLSATIYYAQEASPPSSDATRQRVVGKEPVASPSPRASNTNQTVAPISSAPSVIVPATPIVTAPVLSTGAAWSAAAQNTRLKFNLDWAFGGRPQRGWYLYTALINQEIGTQRDASSTDFALALARWQQAMNLTPSGVLDSDTFYQMIALWQSRRIKEQERFEATPAQLLTAPIIDFYDPTRALELLKVEKQTYAAYKRMVAAAAQDSSLKLSVTSNGELSIAEKYLKIISAFRSHEYQAQLRRQAPNAGRAALAVNSPHFTGRALDIYVGGDPVDTHDYNRAIQTNTSVYKWLVRNAARFGFYPYYYEPWHWEYIPTNGPAAAITHLSN